MVSKSGEASKLIQLPQAEPTVEETASVEVPSVVETTTDVPKIVGTVSKPIIEEPSEKQQPVLLGAVEVDDEKIFVAGTGEPGRAVNIYIDDKYIGAAKISKNGSFLLEADATLKFGNHHVRADMLKKNSAQVSARAQVPLIHDAPVELQAAAQKLPEPVAPVVTKQAPAKTVIEVAANEPAAPTIAPTVAPKITLEKPRLQSEEKTAVLTKPKPSSPQKERNMASPSSPTVGAIPNTVLSKNQ